jgi:hypothetical protein
MLYRVVWQLVTDVSEVIHDMIKAILILVAVKT